MNAINFDSFEKNVLEKPKLDLIEKLDSLNKCFKTSVSPENGVYGITEIVKDTGVVEKTYRDEKGLLTREYYQNGKIFCLRNKNIDGTWTTSRFDDNGVAYLKETVIKGKKSLKSVSMELSPGVKVVKGNFSAQIDEFGRPVLNKIKDVVVKEGSRENLSKKLKDVSYKEGDERGHLISDNLGGTATKENIVPQSFNVNRSQMVKVENIVKQLKAEGHTVDYEVKTNYVGTNKRPSSFEPQITVDGKIYDGLPSDLKKIYNKDNAGTLTKITANIGEKVGIHHELGLKAGIEAAALTCAISTIDNVSQYISGDVTAEEMVVNIAKDTGTAGTIGYGVGFVSSAVSHSMSKSSHELIKAVSKSGVPAAVVAFGISSYDSISDFAQGEIDGEELAYDLGNSVASVAGGMAGTWAATAAGAKVGAVLGSVVPGAGTATGAAVGAVAGFGVSVVGGMVGTAVASEAYKTAVELGGKGVEVLASKVQEVASGTVESAKVEIPDKVDEIRSVLNDFAKSNKLPFHV